MDRKKDKNKGPYSLNKDIPYNYYLLHLYFNLPSYKINLKVKFKKIIKFF